MHQSTQTNDFIGKRCLVKIPERDQRGRIVLGRWVEAGGTIKYIGPNPLLNIPLMVILDRMPIEIKTLKDIKLI